MKKLFLSIVLLALPILSFTQEDVREMFISILAEECNGYLENSKNDDRETKVKYINLPSHYDFELVQLSVSKIIREYSDVSMKRYWTSDSMNNGTKYIGCFLIISGDLLMVNYFENGNFIMTYYKPDDYTEL